MVVLSLPGWTLWLKERPTSQLPSFSLKGIIKLDPVPGSCSTRRLGWTFGLQVPPTAKKICGLSPVDFSLFLIISHGASYSFERKKKTTILVWQFYVQCHMCWWYQVSEEWSLWYSLINLLHDNQKTWGRLLLGKRGIFFFFFAAAEKHCPL